MRPTLCQLMMILAAPALPAVAADVAPGRAAPEVSCPAVLTAVDQQAAQVPEGWQTFQGPSQHTLNGVEVTIGHPREQSGAIYDSVTRVRHGKGAEILRWRLAPLHDPYLVCHYFGTDVALTRSVSAYATCEMVEVVQGNGKRPARARCY